MKSSIILICISLLILISSCSKVEYESIDLKNKFLAEIDSVSTNGDLAWCDFHGFSNKYWDGLRICNKQNPLPPSLKLKGEKWEKFNCKKIQKRNKENLFIFIHRGNVVDFFTISKEIVNFDLIKSGYFPRDEAFFILHKEKTNGKKTLKAYPFTIASKLSNLIKSDLWFSATCPDSQEYTIYSFLIDSLYYLRELNFIGIADSTQLEMLYYPVLPYLSDKPFPDSIMTELIKDYIVKNMLISPITGDKINSKHNIIIVNSKKVSQFLFDKNKEEKENNIKHTAYNRVILYSRVGFSEDKNNAVVYVEVFRGLMSSYGEYVFLKRTNGKWIVLETMGLWVS